jgi:hypothetical protein
MRDRIDWSGETVACIGSGPSLHADDVGYLRGRCRVIAVNDNYKLAPFADVLYACDLKWWDWHKGAPGFAGSKWTQDSDAAHKYCLNYIKAIAGSGLSLEPGVIHTGQNSGFQAINLAHQFGAGRVLLVGYDMKIGSDGKAHWFGEHPDKARSVYKHWLRHFDAIARQGVIEVINCTRDSALTMFPMQKLADALQA